MRDAPWGLRLARQPDLRAAGEHVLRRFEAVLNRSPAGIDLQDQVKVRLGLMGVPTEASVGSRTAEVRIGPQRRLRRSSKAISGKRRGLGERASARQPTP